MKYIINDFSGGLVDSAAAVKLTDGYRSKCSELTNFYITPANTLKRRPPLRKDETERELFGVNIDDMIITDDQLVLLSNVSLLDIQAAQERGRLPQFLRQLGVEGDVDYQELLNEDGTTRIVNYEFTERNDKWLNFRRYPASIQKLSVFDKFSKFHIRTYFFCIFDPKGGIDSPSHMLIEELEDTQYRVLSAARTVPDNDTVYPSLAFADPVEEPYIVSDKRTSLTRISNLHPHEDGVTFSFAGLRYKYSTRRGLECINGPTLFPSVVEINNSYLNTIPEKRQLPEDLAGPVFCMMLNPKSATGYAELKSSGIDFDRYFENTLNEPFLNYEEDDPITSIQFALNDADTGNVPKVFYTNSLLENYPVFAPIIDGLKNVVSFGQKDIEVPAPGGDGTVRELKTFMFPNIKYLNSGYDFNGAGSVIGLKPDWTAVIQPSVPNVMVKGNGFQTQEVNEVFKNGNGHALGGVGVNVFVYNMSAQTYSQTDPGTVLPEFVMYFTYDYTNPQLVEYFRNRNLISGLYSAGDEYRGVVLQVEDGIPVTKANRPFDVDTNPVPFSTGSDLFSGFKTDSREVSGSTVEYISSVPFSLSKIEQFGVECNYSVLDSGPRYLGRTASVIRSEDFVFDVKPSEVDTPVIVNDKNFDMIPYTARPTVHRFVTGDYYPLHGRSALAIDNSITFSRVGAPDEFSNHIQDYFGSIANISDSVAPTVKSGFGLRSVIPLSTDPVNFTFNDKSGNSDRIQAVYSKSPNEVFIGTENAIHQVLPGSFLSDISFSRVSTGGVTSNIVYDSAYFLTGYTNTIQIIRNFRDFNGITVEKMNTDTSQIEEINNIVPLTTSHKLFLAHKRDSNIVYCFSMQPNRVFKGLSKFEFDENIRDMKALDSDRVAVITSEGQYAELNFATDNNTVYQDDDSLSPIVSRMRTLPLIELYGTSLSFTYRLSITELVVSISGNPKVKFEYIDDSYEESLVRTDWFRHVNGNVLEEKRDFTGFLVNKTPEHINSTIPRIGIVKDDDLPCEIASMIIGVKTDGAGER